MKIIYFDNAATTFPKPEVVYTFMDQFYRSYGVNVGRGQYALANKAKTLVDETRQMLLDLFNAKSHDVVLTHSATDALNIVLQGIKWQRDFNVYITPFEHNAVSRVLNAICQKYNINVHVLKVSKESFEYDLEAIKYQFQDYKPNVIVATHASNVTGLITPIKQICDLAKQFNAITVIDTAQTAGLIDINLSSIKSDYTIFAGHKALYGPLGVGGFIQTKGLSLEPIIYGGTGIESSNVEMPKEIPKRYEAGSLNIHAIAGLNASLKWLNDISINNLHKKEEFNISELINILSSYNNIKIVGRNAKSNYVGVVSCIFEDYSSSEIGQVLNKHCIAVRTGLHCAPTAHKFLNTYPSGTVRFSLSYFNDDSDFNKLVEVLDLIENSY